MLYIRVLVPRQLGAVQDALPVQTLDMHPQDGPWRFAFRPVVNEPDDGGLAVLSDHLAAAFPVNACEVVQVAVGGGLWFHGYRFLMSVM